MIDNNENEKIDTEFDPEFDSLTETLITIAMNNEHTEKELITNLGAYFISNDVIRALRKTADSLMKGADKLYYAYIDSLNNCIDEPSLLFAARTLKDAADYYYEEANIVVDEKAEFRHYMFSGHFINMLFGDERPEEDMVDWRKRENK